MDSSSEGEDRMKRRIVACLLAASTVLIAIPAFVGTAHADPVAVSGSLKKGGICDAVAGTGNSHGSATITGYGTGDPNLREVTVGGFLKKAGKRVLWNVYLRQVTGGTPIDTQIGFAWSGKKTHGKFHFSLVYALETGSYQLQVLFSKQGNTPDNCPGTNPMSYKTGVLALDVP
jgi:hypothetical protein